MAVRLDLEKRTSSLYDLLLWLLPPSQKHRVRGEIAERSLDFSRLSGAVVLRKQGGGGLGDGLRGKLAPRTFAVRKRPRGCANQLRRLQRAALIAVLLWLPF